MATTEERLAALEAKMAQLTATTPTTYYTHQYSGEEIDAAVGRAMPNGAIDQAVGTFVRPNLLDNWYFGNPVNQRGKTEQYGGGYFIDRWTASEGKFALTNNGLTLCVDGVNSWLSQWLDVDVEGQIITVSALTADGKLYTSTGQLTKQSDVRVSFDGGGYVSCGYIAEISMFRFTLARYDTTLPITIRAVKLELGSTQTLAHQDANGNWVLNEIPDYGEQLRRCQYYSRFFGGDIEIPCSNNPAGTYIEGTLPLTMRSGNGSISYSGGFLFFGDRSFYDVSGANVSSNGGRVKIGVNVSSQLQSNLQATLYLKNCSILFDL